MQGTIEQGNECSEVEKMATVESPEVSQLEKNAVKYAHPLQLKERIAKDMTELIGCTPLVEINNVTKSEGAFARIVAKVEGQLPFCSVKDRMALHMVEAAEREQLIRPGVTTLLEMTSGNTGIALAAVGVLKGYRVVVVMPASSSFERRILIRSYGAELILTDPAKGFAGMGDKVKELLETIPNSFWVDQPSNPKNAEAHFVSTGPEIWRDTAGKVDFLVAGCGTGGTISGAGRYLKAQNPKVKVVAVEPTESAVLSGGAPGPHVIQGLGPGFIPAVTDTSLFDEVVTSSGEEAMHFAARLAKEEALLVGISSGAVFSAALKIAQRPENKGKLIVAILPSAGERYLSTSLFATVKEECENMTFQD